MFMTDIGGWVEAGRARTTSFFADIRTATSMRKVSALMEPGLLVKVEADVVITR